MRCPNKRCGLETDRTIIAFRRTANGKPVKFEGCPSCYSPRREAQQERLRTGQKIWVADEAYGPAKTHQMNQDWGVKIKERAERNRRANATISEGAYNYLVSETRSGKLRDFRDRGRR